MAVNSENGGPNVEVLAKNVIVVVDPPYPAFYNNELFNANSKLNRDNQLAHFILLKQRLEQKGICVHLADYPLTHQISGKIIVYSSFGVMTNYRKLAKRDDLYLQSFYILEGATTGPQTYSEINNLTKYFRKVYVFNTEGIGYEKYFNTRLKLDKFNNPQMRNEIIEDLWYNRERGCLCLINANKFSPTGLHLIKRATGTGFPLRFFRNPGINNTELYSERIRALLELQKFGDIDLYGYGWDTPVYKILLNIFRDQTFTFRFLSYRKLLLPIYKGVAGSKHEVLSKYNFNICFENLVMPGWITEKIFDCFYAGTIPIYLGAPDIESYISKDCFIDMRDFKSYAELHAYLHSLSPEDIDLFREAGRDYLSSEKYYRLFTKERFVEQFEEDLVETLKVNGIKLVD